MAYSQRKIQMMAILIIFSFIMYQQHPEIIKKIIYNNLPDKITILINSADIAKKKAQECETWYQKTAFFYTRR